MEVGNAEAATNQSVAQVPGSLHSAAGSRACTRPIAARWPNLGLVPARRGAVQRKPPPAAPRGGTPPTCARNTPPVAPTRLGGSYRALALSIATTVVRAAPK